MCFDLEGTIQNFRDLPQLVGFWCIECRHECVEPVCCECVTVRACLRGCCDVEGCGAIGSCVTCRPCDEECVESAAKSCSVSKWVACLKETIHLTAALYHAIIACVVVAAIIGLWRLNAYLATHSYTELFYEIAKHRNNSTAAASDLSTLIIKNG